MMRLSYRSPEILLEDVQQRAYQLEKEYHGCAQCVLGALMQSFPMLEDHGAFKAATGLGGGIGLSTEGSCGGLTGGVLALGLLFGRERENLPDKEGIRFRSYRMANRLQERFVKEFGSSRCRNIHESVIGKAYRLNQPDEWQAFLEAGGHSDKCPSVVGRAAKWTARLLLEEAAAAGKPFTFSD